MPSFVGRFRRALPRFLQTTSPNLRRRPRVLVCFVPWSLLLHVPDEAVICSVDLELILKAACGFRFSGSHPTLTKLSFA